MVGLVEKRTNKELFQRLQKVIPGGANSPVRNFSSVGIDPLIVKEAHGPYLFDAAGKRYIDYCLSWGALIHGHAHPFVNECVIEQVNRGTSYGLSTENEAILAEKIISHIPSIESIRFVSSGTESTMSAARLARGFTSKEILIKFDGCYHGHSDGFLKEAGSGLYTMGATSSSKGVPESFMHHTISLPYNDVDAFEKILENKEIRKNIAGVIIEPVAANMGLIPAERSFLAYLRARTKELQSLLIFDEVVTGFRVGLQGAQGLYQIEPDLTCLGKIIGGGFPCAAFGGKKEIMDHLAPLGDVYQAGTLSGNPVATAAGIASLTLLEGPGFYETLEKKAALLWDPIEACIKEKELPATLHRIGSMATLFFGPSSVQSRKDLQSLDKGRFIAFFQYLFERGMFIPPAQQEIMTLSSRHTEECIQFTLHTIMEFLKL